ncbi:protein kinase [Streptomyces sp. NPDC002773]|uniref:serine/threonine-protein kinase n=1 Tax=Streptomyces sp. NPDC002773 TaxID=3154430 RepID=UPI0033265D4F
MDLPGHIGGYAVERELGAGGMGMVYLARSRGGRTVAVKVARPELAADPHFRARFRAEVEAARKVGGFHTAQVVDADPDAETPWLATAYVPGPTLSGLLAEKGPMDERQLRLLGAALAEALQAIHACGLVHRDLKPGNIIMADDGPRVLDFGIARAVESTRLTATGSAFGTPGFLAPEQAQGREVGSAADVFALGAVLVAAAGGSAFGEGTPMVLMYRSVHEQPDLSTLPQDLQPIVADCLAKDPAQRPTPGKLLDLFSPDTALYTPTLPVSAVPPELTPTPTQAAPTEAAPVPTTAPPRKKLTEDRIAAFVAITLAVASLAGFGAYSLNGWFSAPFPEATHRLTAPIKVAGGAYELANEKSSSPGHIKDTEYDRDVISVDASYTGTEKAPVFQKVDVNGGYGRFKNLKGQRDALLHSVSVTGTEIVDEPRKEIRVPGSDVEFSCQTVSWPHSYPARPTKTQCAWSDGNTQAVVEFVPAGPLELAAAETRKIRDDMRKPID